MYGCKEQGGRLCVGVRGPAVAPGKEGGRRGAPAQTRVLNGWMKELGRSGGVA